MASKKPKLVIIGGGLAGLSAAHAAINKGIKTTVFESYSRLGGLAVSLFFNGRPIEKYYHFICKGDREAVSLIHELGIKSKLHWRKGHTSLFYDGRMYKFDNGLSLMRFNPLRISQRLAFGVHVLRSRMIGDGDWPRLDNIDVESWLVKNIGREAYSMIWEPLLRFKFGDKAGAISAAWLWHRLKRVAESTRFPWEPPHFGYLENGFQDLIDALAQKLEQSRLCEIRRGVTVKKILHDNAKVTGAALDNDGQVEPADVMISTIPLPKAARIIDFPNDFNEKLVNIKFIGLVCLLLKMKRPLSNVFWLNIHDKRIMFNGLIEFTNLNPRPDLAGAKFLHVPFYVDRRSAQFKKSNQKIYRECCDGFKIINPAFNEDWVEDYYVFREEYAQPVCDVGFLGMRVGFDTPVDGLYLTDSTQLYPEDRTVTGSIRLGQQAVELALARNRE